MTTKGTKRQNSICLLEKDGDYNQKQRCRELIMEINKAREKEYVDFTLDYYDVNAESFCFGTQNAAFSEHQDTFLSYLPPQASILDLGCGSGRDSRAFLHKGYDVEAMDGSKELCRLASQCIGKEVKCCKFQELEAENLYDGIWACASILHVSKTELYLVLRKMCDALKSGGIIYTSFKYGEFEGNRNGRYFTDFTEISFQEYIRDISEFSIEEIWITGDVRPGRGDEKWLNLILRKMDIHCQSMENT